MSNFDNSSLFMEPRTNQYGSHMIMTNVHKPTKTKYVMLTPSLVMITNMAQTPITISRYLNQLLM